MEQQNKNFKLVSNKKTRVILPNMFTLIGVCIGLSSIKFAFDEKFTLSVIAIIVAAIIDGLDGRIARLIQGTSKVGKELDSLTDVISFGVAPAFIMYFWKLNELGRIGWLICLIYVVCVALRLARFNVNSGKEPSWRDNFFEGVPSPAGGVLVLMPLIYSLSDIQIINVNYESLVENFEEEVKKLFVKLNLNWEKQLYDFHKNERPVETASLIQVRSKIYKKSSEQWKSYEKYLTSMTDILSSNNVKF